MTVSKLYTSFERLVAAFSIFSICLGLFPTPTFAEFAVSTLRINNVIATTYSFNPGATFSVDVYSSNTLAEAIKLLYARITFGNNAGFTYSGADQRTRINGVTITSPVPSSAYNSTTGFTTEITNGTTTQVAGWVATQLGRASNNFNAFTVSPNITTYENTTNFWFEAQKVSDSSAVVGTTSTVTIYANVKPHVTDFFFENTAATQTLTQVTGGGEQSFNFVAYVKDYNGCANIDAATVTADLSSLGLSTAETLTYTSCQGDGKTAVFKKNNISTFATTGTKTFTASTFVVATDEDGNRNMPNDPNTTFDADDRASDLSLVVAPASAPTLTLVSLSESRIGGSTKPSTLLTFSANQSGEIKVSFGSDGSCVGGTTLLDWTGSGSYTSGTNTGITITASSLSDGANSIFACAKNPDGVVGSLNVSVTKDTTAPTISAYSIAPGSVVTDNASATFKCSEDGTYRVEVGGGGVLGAGNSMGTAAATANTSNTATVTNASLSMGGNTIWAFCTDAAGNTASSSLTLNKVIPTPSMATETVTLADTDVDYDGLDGRDVYVTFGTGSSAGFSGFESYRVYLLPTATAFNANAHTSIGLISSATTSTFTGLSTTTNDSAGSAIVGGTSYKVCVAIMGLSGQLGTPGCSAGATLTSDTVAHPVPTSARFFSSTGLEITTDSALSATLTEHSGALVSVQVGGVAYTGSAILGVNNTKLLVTIPSLAASGSSATGSNLIIGANAIRASGGGYNLAYASGSFAITDGQAPTFSALATGTTAAYGSYYSGSIAFSYTTSEALQGAGLSQVRLTRSVGNSDATVRTYTLSGSELNVGSSTVSLNLPSLGLVSGAGYTITLYGTDAGGNAAASTTSVWPIYYDAVGPAAPTLDGTSVFSTLTPTLTWSVPQDDQGNGSWIKQTIVRIYSGSGCSGTPTQTGTVLVAAGGTYTASPALSTNQAYYAWTATAYDQLDNVGTTSTCKTFYVDTTVPTLSAAQVLDATLSSTGYTKSGNTISVSATIANSSSGNIWLNASQLTGGSAYSAVQCSAPNVGITCSYSANTATYTFVAGLGGAISEGVRQAQFSAANTSGVGTGTTIASTVVDATNPTASANTITSPNGGEYLSGSTTTVTWSSSAFTDTNGIAAVRLEYATGAGVWNIISTGSNAGTRSWSLSGLADRTDYVLRAIAYDGAGNSASDVSNAVFTIDRTAPSVLATALTSPNGGEILKGGTTQSITWNPAAITDTIGLAASPITLAYSSNNGSAWTTIASGLANDGTYSWTMPSVTSSQMLVRITAYDAAGNSASDTSDTVFRIDATAPTLNVASPNTPPSGSYINTSGIDVSITASDALLDTVQYSFANLTDSTYWNGSAYAGTQTWNTLCTDNTVGWTSNNCDSISTSITPTIVASKTYRLIVRATDEAGNITTSSNFNYTADLTAPTITFTTASGSFVGTGITLQWTASDSLAGLSSTVIEIKKWAQWWNGSTFVGTQQLLATSGTAANWTYAFVPSGADTSGQAYTVTATTYDQTYRTNNSNSASIGITLDTTAPSINASGLWSSPTASEVRIGGTSLAITWNAANLSDGLSGLAANPVTLEYYNPNTTSYVTIASNLPNSGTYNWTLPSVDFATNVRLVAIDAVGNQASANSSSFTIDSTPATIQTVQTLDTDANGQIDGLAVTMSEPIVDSSLHISHFAISGGITPVAINNPTTSPFSANDAYFEITFANTGTTATTPTLTFTAGAGRLLDVAGHTTATASPVATDAAVPRLLSASVYDVNSNGKIDAIYATFSEPLQATTNTSAWSLQNTIAGVSIASSSVSSNQATIVLNEPTDYNTAPSGMTLGFTSTVSWKDTTGNQAGNLGSALALGDAAAPKMVSSRTRDANANGKIDAIELTFSETISGMFGSFSVGNLATGASYGGSITQTSGQVLSLAIAETSTTSDSAQIPTVAYSGTSIVDAASLALATFSATSVSDGVAPKILSRTTRDASGDGKLDGVELTFSENINDTTGGFTATVNGYTVTGYNTLANGSTANDTKLSLVLDPKTLPDTGATPAVEITNNSTLGDASGNVLAADTSGGVTPTDGAGPVLLGARYEETGTVATSKLYLTFSEAVDSATLNTTAGGVTSDFILTSGGAFASASTLGSVTATTGVITLGAGAAAPSAGVSQLSFATAGVVDTAGNPSPTASSANRVTVSASIIINEVMVSSTAANRYIELYNLSSSVASLSGWTIANAGVTIPSGVTIPANGYYLIAAANESSSILNVTPDLVTALAFNTTSQSDIALKDASSVTMDTAKASPWAAGTPASDISMERLSSVGNGALAASWYSAQTSVGFDTTTPKGTPKSVNVYDAVSPTITASTPTTEDLFPHWSVPLTFTYSDNLAINAASASLVIEKWNGSAWTSVSSAYITGSVSTASASYHTNALPLGRYQATFSVNDTAGNTSTPEVIVFYIDALQVNITTTTLPIGVLGTSSATFSTTTTTVTVSTIGAGFSLSTLGDAVMTIQGWASQLAAWNGSHGFGYDYSQSGSGGTQSYAGTLTAANSAIQTVTKSPNTDGTAKTYTYNIRYGAKTDVFQPAGIYSAQPRIVVQPNY